MRCCVIVLRTQIFNCISALNDRSSVHELTGETIRCRTTVPPCEKLDVPLVEFQRRFSSNTLLMTPVIVVVVCHDQARHQIIQSS